MVASKRRRPRKKAKPRRVAGEPCVTSGKVRFKTYEVAAEELRFKRALYSDSKRVPVRVYKCPDCSDYHLTSKEKYGDLV